MKKIFTLCILAIVVIRSNSQVVLNEVYPEPGNGKQEFFELYNTSTSQVPENLDNYTLVAYYEESGKSGFYVLDLPNATVASKGFYAGSSQTTFNIQGQSNLTADLNWNSLPSSASLTKWQISGSSYISVAVPANLNDLFVKINGGSGGNYSVFVYKNGILINGIIGGASGNVIPASIKAMPDLPVDMTGSSPDFTIKFSAMTDNSVEYINANAGTNNGYYRQYDGKCGVWLKSTSATDHTPGKSNGSASNVLGTLTITANISTYNPDPSKSLLTYNISAGPADAFPVVVEVYQDLGITGELDASDLLVDSKTINNSSSGNQNIIMPTATDGAMLVVKSPSGCYDRVISVDNTLPIAAKTLPVHLISFQGNMNKNNKVTLNWTAAENETVDHFEVERSVNGKDFTTVAVVFATEKTGNENYIYFETINSNDKVMFRLKMFDKGQDIDYSKILVFQTKSVNSNEIKVYGNPVKDKLTFSYVATANQITDVKVYDFSGKVVMSQKVNSQEGSNMMSLPLQSTFKSGMYVVEVSNGSDRQIAKFVKQ
jgi:hypothetical protein